MTLDSQQRLPPPAFEDLHHIRDNDVRKVNALLSCTYLPTYVFV